MFQFSFFGQDLPHWYYLLPFALLLPARVKAKHERSWHGEAG
jgi:hypothetical protein